MKNAGCDGDGAVVGRVDTWDDGGHFARFGEPAPQRHGVHAGVHCGVTRMAGGVEAE